STSQPAEVSSGEPQLPTCSSSQAAAGPCSGTSPDHERPSAEVARLIVSPSPRHNATCVPPTSRGNSATPLLRAAGPVRANALNDVRSALSSSRGVTVAPLYAV